MLARLMLMGILIVISLFCWLSLLNPFSIDFRFFGKMVPTDLSTLMITSFVLGAVLVFVSTLTRDAKRAIEGYQKSRQVRRGQSVKEELNKAMDYFLRGDLVKAKAHFREVLKKDPSQVDVYFRLSDIALKEGNEEEALHWLERARLFDMRNVEVLLSEASLYQRMKRFPEAIRSLTLALGLDETNLQALRNLRGIHLEGRKWEEAIRVQKSILKLTKGKKAEEEEILFYLGLKYEHARELLEKGGEENVENALKEAKEIVREGKTFQAGFLLLGDIYLQIGRWVSAGKVWGKSFTRFKSMIFMLRLEDLYLGREDPSTLLRIYQRVLQRNPEHWVIAFFYAKLCLRLEMLDEALEEINEISLRVQDFPALHRLLAEIYLHKKDFGRAAHEFRKTFELSGTSYLPFYCTTCKKESREWIVYCPQCHRWGSYTIQEEGKTLPKPSISYSNKRAHFRLDA